MCGPICEIQKKSKKGKKWEKKIKRKGKDLLTLTPKIR